MTASHKCPIRYEQVLADFQRAMPFRSVERTFFHASKPDLKNYSDYFSDPYAPTWDDAQLRDACLSHFKRKVGLDFHVENKEFWRQNKLAHTYFDTQAQHSKKALDRGLNLLSGELTFSRFFYELAINCLQGFPLFRPVGCKVKDGPVDLEYAQSWNMLSESQLSGQWRTRALSPEEITRLVVLTEPTLLLKNIENHYSYDSDSYRLQISVVNMPHPSSPGFKLHWAGGTTEFGHSKYIRKGWISPPPPEIRPLNALEMDHLLALAYTSQDPILREYFESNMDALQKKFMSQCVSQTETLCTG